MTTIVFDGEYLVADSRRTNGNEVSDTAIKIHTIEGVTYQGEKVIAWAGAGVTKLLGCVLKIFMDDPDKLKEVYKNVHLTGLLDNVNLSCSVLFVTEKSAYTFRVTRSGVSNIDKDMTFPVDPAENKLLGLGSGSREAMFLRRLFDVPLVMAVAATELAGDHVGTGGVTTWIRIANGEVIDSGVKAYVSNVQIYDDLVKHVSSKACKLRVKSRSLVVKTVKAKERPKVVDVELPLAPVTAVAKKTATKKKARAK